MKLCVSSATSLASERIATRFGITIIPFASSERIHIFPVLAKRLARVTAVNKTVYVFSALVPNK